MDQLNTTPSLSSSKRQKSNCELEHHMHICLWNFINSKEYTVLSKPKGMKEGKDLSWKSEG